MLFGVVIGEGPGRWGLIGLVLAAAGVLVIARTGAPAAEPAAPGREVGTISAREQGAVTSGPPPVVAVLLAAGGLGVVMVLVDAAAADGQRSPLWVAAGLQLGGVGALAAVVMAGPHARVAVPRDATPLLANTAVLFAEGDIALAFAMS